MNMHMVVTYAAYAVYGFALVGAFFNWYDITINDRHVRNPILRVVTAAFTLPLVGLALWIVTFPLAMIGKFLLQPFYPFF